MSRREPVHPASLALAPVCGTALTVMLAAADALAVRDPLPALRLTPAAADLAGAPLPDVLAGPPVLRVRLRSPAATVLFAVDGPYRIVAGEADHAGPPAPLIASGPGLDDVSAAPGPSGILLNGEHLPASRLSVIPRHDGTLSVGGRGYRGALLLRRQDDRVIAVNVVPLEDYLAGVLLAEMPGRFGHEALRAQAVASRTYALHEALRGRELWDDQGSQVYGGSGRETATARQIVRSTFGEVLTWDGATFPAFFHASCGGMTSSAAAVFRIAAPPPLAGGVPCRGCADSPYASWTRRLPDARVAAIHHHAFGERLTFTVAERDAAGRALTIVLQDERGGEVDRVPAERFRVDANSGLRLDDALLSSLHDDPRREGDAAILHGSGFGHGVGLCQYGAAGEARHGVTYREILARYYPGAALRRLYE